MASAKEKLESVVRLVQSVNLDSWLNVATGLGQALSDKRLGGFHRTDRYNLEQLEDLWEGDDLGARIVEVLPDEMFREGWRLGIEGDKNNERSKALLARVDELEFNGKVHEALSTARALGGGALLVGAEDGQSFEKPLDETRIKRFDYLTVLSPRELEAATWYDNPLGPKFGLPRHYRLRPTRTSNRQPELDARRSFIHESRLIIFQGVRVPRRTFIRNRGWGNSVFVRVSHVLRDFNQSWGSAAILLQDFSAATLKVKGLSEMLSRKNSDWVVQRASQVELTRSTARVAVIDSEEDFARQATPTSGLPELLEKFTLRLAAAARLPVTLLMGQAPAGLNATGESDIRWFYDTVAAAQESSLRPVLNRLVKLLLLADGNTEPENWSITFNPLWQLGELEQADLRLKTAQADAAWITAEVLLPEEVASSRFGGNEFSTDTKLDDKLRREFTEEAELELEAEAELASKQVEKPEGVQGASPTAPPEGVAPGQVEGDANVNPDATLNGAQVSALLEIVQAVGERRLPRDSAVAIILASFPVDQAQAEKILGSVGTTFFIETAAPPGEAPPPPAPSEEEA